MIASVPLLREVKASYALVERNIHLTKRYWGWEIAFLAYTIAQSLAIVLTSVGLEHLSKGEFSAKQAQQFTLYLAIGTLTWSYMASLFLAIAESIQWERWEGTIEYSLMAPISRMTYMLGACVFAVIYGLVRTAFVLLALALTFNLNPNMSGLWPSILIVAIGSLSFVGIGIMAASLPLLFTEKGAQMTYVIEAALLLVSGVYYPVSALPWDWVQKLSYLSPATYILSGARAFLINGAGTTTLVNTLKPLIIIGAITIPMGMWVFGRAEHFAKRTGRLKRTG